MPAWRLPGGRLRSGLASTPSHNRLTAAAALSIFLGTPSSVAVIRAPLPPSHQAQRDRAGNMGKQVPDDDQDAGDGDEGFDLSAA